MKTVVILSTDNLGMTVADMLNPREMKLVGMGDTRQETWNVFSDLEKGELKEEIEGIPIMPADLAVALQPDVLVIAATDSEKSHALEYMAIRAGFLNDIVFIRDLHEQFSIRCSVLRRLCRRLTGLGVEGNVAELGCYRGDTSWQLNVLMPDRKLYLFDTFEGFDERDVDMERKLGCSDAQTGLYSGTDKEKLMERMPLPGQVVIRKGWFPETAFDIVSGLHGRLPVPAYPGRSGIFLSPHGKRRRHPLKRMQRHPVQRRCKSSGGPGIQIRRPSYASGGRLRRHSDDCTSVGWEIIE